ncbi:D-methionine-binding lipoprotein metQ precursor [Oligella ureolytica]|uniref:Lipoprotein n=1 Tax=Oligella ureolytica TaxID=90244 RepID=A0A378XJ32_9BURK|nr:MetQ/NlpA family ABC transporter substrate-binding protein [Oligella ureolytica]QPT39426.1 MetQ/NlpA family ABC transporter substrate-binding protein [Oligella ureolytica]SUA56123.1 D-methionine-binding lipoprotein metQ precursor [Oligella ureolytica]
MKKNFALKLSALMTSALMVTGTASANETLSVAATPVPAAEILEFMVDQLAEQGVDLKVHVFTDFIQPNQQVVEKQVDMNCFQHKPHLDSFNANEGQELVPQGYTYVIPLGAYSTKINSIDELKDRASVAIPSDTTNGARALLLLQKAGLITLEDPDNLFATSRDIAQNPKKLKFVELEAATIPRVLSDVDLAVINTNYALDANLNPQRDSLFMEDTDSPYANLCASRVDNQDREAIQKLNAAWQSPETLKFIEEKYQGTVIPVKAP